MDTTQNSVGGLPKDNWAHGTKAEELWDAICSSIEFDKEKEGMIREFVKLGRINAYNEGFEDGKMNLRRVEESLG